MRDAQQKADLAARAVEEGWTCDVLDAAVRSTRGEAPGRAGRPELPSYLKALYRYRRYVRADHFSDVERVVELDEGTASTVAEIAAEMRARADQVEAGLRRRSTGVISSRK